MTASYTVNRSQIPRTLPEVWYKPGSSSEESVLLVSQRANYAGYGAVMLRASKAANGLNTDWLVESSYENLTRRLAETGWERLPEGSSVTLLV